MSRADDRELDERRGQQPLDLGHRRDEPLAPRLAQRLEERAGQLVALPVEQLTLGEPRARQLTRAHASVPGARVDADEPGALERAQQAAEVARVELEARAQPADVAAVGSDLPEHPRLAERPVAREVVVFERADSLRDEPVEAPHLTDRGVGHSLILVRDLPCLLN